MVWGLNTGHPYGHLTQQQIDLFAVFIVMPCADFVFDVRNWVVRHTSGFEFSQSNEYATVIRNLGAHPIYSMEQAQKNALRMLDLGPEFLSQNFGTHFDVVNWGRDGF